MRIYFRVFKDFPDSSALHVHCLGWYYKNDSWPLHMTCFHVPHLRRHQYHSVIVGLKLPPEKFFLQPGAVVVDPSGTMTTRGIGSNKVIIRRIVHVTVTQFCLSKSPFVVPRILLR